MPKIFPTYASATPGIFRTVEITEFVPRETFPFHIDYIHHWITATILNPVKIPVPLTLIGTLNIPSRLKIDIMSATRESIAALIKHAEETGEEDYTLLRWEAHKTIPMWAFRRFSFSSPLDLEPYYLVEEVEGIVPERWTGVFKVRVGTTLGKVKSSEWYIVAECHPA